MAAQQALSPLTGRAHPLVSNQTLPKIGGETQLDLVPLYACWEAPEESTGSISCSMLAVQ